MAVSHVKINRAPVLTLWAAVVAERLGYSEDEALTLGRAVAGLNAQSKGRRLGIYPDADDQEQRDDQKDGQKAASQPAEEAQTVALLGRAVPARQTAQGWRALSKGSAIAPASVRRYLEDKFGDHLTETRAVLQGLAAAYTPQELAGRAYALYEEFRPEIPEGQKGWGAAGTLDLDRIHQLARKHKSSE